MGKQSWLVKREEMKTAQCPDDTRRWKKQRGSQSLRWKEEEKNKWIPVNLNFLPVRDLAKSILLTSTETYQVASIRILKHYYILLHIFLL